jgi:hypothetical protein
VGQTGDIEYVARLLDDYARGYRCFNVAAEDPEDGGVPPHMQVGAVNAQGWVEWQMLPSTLAEGDIDELEREFKVQLPPLYRAYLLARFHLFKQVHSAQHDQLILMPAIPSEQRLNPIRELMRMWQPLLDAEFVPFAQWGDGWGPMCFDTQQRRLDMDCPVVWMDHERLFTLGPEHCRMRALIVPLAQPLYASFSDFLRDVFALRDT